MNGGILEKTNNGAYVSKVQGEYAPLFLSQGVTLITNLPSCTAQELFCAGIPGVQRLYPKRVSQKSPVKSTSPVKYLIIR